jgi:hypothetical protein
MSGRGTRFRLFPQPPPVYAEPETVMVSSPAGSLGPGPCDARMYVVLPAVPKQHYVAPDNLPPYDGPQIPPARPSASGDFDHLPVDSMQFLAAHLYGAARFTLDIWEAYLGERLRWWHEAVYPRLELVPVVDWNNAHSGPGYIETGIRSDRQGNARLSCLNFDIVAHEIGHAIAFSEIGAPEPGRLSAQYLAFHEAFSDLVALISALHFESVIDRFLEQTGGNLYALSIVNRVAELSDAEQIRTVDFNARLRDFDGLALRPDGGWDDPSGGQRTQHDLSHPLTAAIFAIMIEIYQDRLVQRGILAPDDDARGWSRDEVDAEFGRFARRIRRRFWSLRDEFAAALAHARDVVGRCLVTMLRGLPADDMTFSDVATRFVAAAIEHGQLHNHTAIRRHFTDRDIEPAAAPPILGSRRRISYLERVVAARLARSDYDVARLVIGIDRYASIRRLMPHGFRAEAGF